MIIDLQQKITQLHTTPSDINEHFPTILHYGGECEVIVEMGVRGIVSTWGWLACNPKKLTCYDLFNPSNWGGNIHDIYDTAQQHDIDFNFILGDVLKIEIEPTDLLFIDTWHAYHQLKQELKLHASKVKKYICFHDTTSYGYKDEIGFFDTKDTNKGIWPAIEEFLDENKNEWVLEKRFTNNNGFTIIKRIN
jgi:hypothetical protein